MSEEKFVASGKGPYEVVMRKLSLTVPERPALGEQTVLVVLGRIDDFSDDTYFIVPTIAMFDCGDFFGLPDDES